MRKIAYFLVVVFLVSLCGCATTSSQNEEPSKYYKELFGEKDYTPKPEPTKSQYIRLMTGKIETPCYYERVFILTPKEGKEIRIPVDWNDKIGEYEVNQQKLEEYEKHYTAEQKKNLLIMFSELALIQLGLEELKLRLELMQKM